MRIDTLGAGRFDELGRGVDGAGGEAALHKFERMEAGAAAEVQDMRAGCETRAEHVEREGLFLCHRQVGVILGLPGIDVNGFAVCGHELSKTRSSARQAKFDD